MPTINQYVFVKLCILSNINGMKTSKHYKIWYFLENIISKCKFKSTYHEFLFFLSLSVNISMDGLYGMNPSVNNTGKIWNLIAVKILVLKVDALLRTSYALLTHYHNLQ